MQQEEKNPALKKVLKMLLYVDRNLDNFAQSHPDEIVEKAYKTFKKMSAKNLVRIEAPLTESKYGKGWKFSIGKPKYPILALRSNSGQGTHGSIPYLVISTNNGTIKVVWGRETDYNSRGEKAKTFFLL
ncbi:adaptor complexes medium subunit family protein [Risungbinella massiliensis]|uniref:hypothetical protein n=1 Tax=Risungbinella massiliensis TaxID=1329796 RepID=UPI0005CBADF1|nr:hypothetical protein [Risungbinella massiliensis]